MNRIVITEIVYNSKEFLAYIELDENRRFEKLQLFPTSEKSLVGNIYVARVDKIVKGINSAFVKISNDTNCYLSLNCAVNPIYTNKKSKKPDLCEGDEILVQVTKDAIKTKAAVVSTNISISTNYVVSTTNNTTKAVSKKIKSERAKELKQLIDETLIDIDNRDDFGIVLRTASKDVDNEIIINELKKNINILTEIISCSRSREIYTQLYQANEAYITKLKGVDFNNIDCILTDSDSVYKVIKQELSCMADSKIKLYTDDYSLNHLYQLDTNISKLVSKQVWLNSGGNIIIEQLETLTFIDVNTSKGSLANQNVIEKTNKEAALEIARQLRLRNISGMIIVDFINNETDEANKELISYLKVQLANDEVTCSFVDITRLGLVEITRKKVYKSLKEIL